MKRAVRLNREYPFAPDAVWRALTDRELLSAWLMENDFEPRVGHRFTMRTEPGPGFDGIVHAEVLELDPPKRMKWSWRGGTIDTTLTFRLEPRVVFATQGTRLWLDHDGFDGLPAVLTSMILEAGWRRIFSSRLNAVLGASAAGTSPHAAVKAAPPRKQLWFWLSRLFAPVLRRTGRRT